MQESQSETVNSADVTTTPKVDTTKPTESTQTLTTTKPALTQDSKNMALLNWLGCLFFGLIAPLALYLLKKDDAYVLEQAKEALNWSITLLIGYIALWLLAIVVGVISFGLLAIIPILLMVVLSIVHLVFCVMGTMKTSSGEAFKVPFSIRLIK